MLEALNQDSARRPGNGLDAPRGPLAFKLLMLRFECRRLLLKRYYLLAKVRVFFAQLRYLRVCLHKFHCLLGLRRQMLQIRRIERRHGILGDDQIPDSLTVPRLVGQLLQEVKDGLKLGKQLHGGSVVGGAALANAKEAGHA